MKSAKAIVLTSLVVGLAMTSLANSAPAFAKDQRAETGERQERQRLFPRRQRESAPPADLVIRYGEDELQDIGLYLPNTQPNAPAPLVVFVHGGGWRMGNRDNATGAYKSGHYTDQGYHFASVNYRLVPEATVEQQAQDVANAVKALVVRADTLGIDASRVVLMGHSAGAHLVSLVSTDPQYLRAAGLGMDAVLGTIPLDGAAYNVPQQMEGQRRFLRNMYENAFGEDRDRQLRLSPTHHAARPNVGNFLILYVGREDGIEQSQQLADRLEQAGVSVQQQQFAGSGLRGHAQINMEMGNPDYAATPVVDAWLRSLFAD